MPDHQFFKDVLTCVEIVTDDSEKTLEDHVPDEDERERMEKNMDKFVGTMRSMRANGTSQRWKPEFVTLMRRAHSAYMIPIDQATKESIRKRRFRCAICGQLEKHADAVIHLAGSPVEDVVECETFDAREWETSRLDKLSGNFDTFYRGYVDVQETEETGTDEDFPAPPYLGVVVPGEECLKHITRLFTAQTLLLDTCYETYNIETSGQRRKLGDTATPERIQSLQTRWDEIVGVDAVPIWSSDVFWNRLLTRFGKFSDVSTDTFDNIDFLQAAYDRLEMSLNAAKLAGSLPSPPKRKRSAVLDDDDEEEEEEEDDDYEEDEEAGGASSSSRPGRGPVNSAANSRRHRHHLRNLRPRTSARAAASSSSGTKKPSYVELDEEEEDDEEDDEDDVVSDLARGKRPQAEPSWARRKRTTPSAGSTAQSLRAPVLESRVKVLKKLADFGYMLVDRPNFQNESIDVFNACAVFQTLLLGGKSSRFARPSAEDVRDVLKNLNTLQSKLLRRGESDEDEDGYVESAIVSAASLTLMEVSKSK
jgi:ribosomal protein L12E/L44/L45/RPP1/RPP2